MVSAKRTVRLTVLDSANEVILKSELLRVDFEVTYSIGDALNTAKIEVYNLKDDTIMRLTQANDVKVSLEVEIAGSNLPDTLFDGDLVNIYHTPILQDGITTLWCWEKGVKGFDKIPPHKTYAKSSVQKVANDIARQAGFGAIDFSQASMSKYQAPVHKFTLDKSYRSSLYRLLKQNGMTMGVSLGVIKVIDAINKTGSVDEIIQRGNSNIIDILPIQLKKPISFSVASADITYVLRPDIRPMDIVSLDDTNDKVRLQGTLAGFSDDTLKLVDKFTNVLPRKFYFLTKVRHIGSVYTDSFDTEMTGIYYDNSRTI